MLWELEEAEKALTEGEVPLARRYISKALEQCRCMYCHKAASTDDPDVLPHFKGMVHAECKNNYNGRIDYERQHGTNSLR